MVHLRELYRYIPVSSMDEIRLIDSIVTYGVTGAEVSDLWYQAVWRRSSSMNEVIAGIHSGL